MQIAMNFRNLLSLALLASTVTVFAASTTPEHHRATRLGNPATRFAPPLATPEDLRARFRDPKLRADFIEVLRQWGWPGNLDVFFAAGLTKEIVEWAIPVGDVMPFMSSREAGKAICLRNVTWAGKEPIQAYAFTFTSNGRLYRCITPKPCSNFFVVDLGPEPKSGLALECKVPVKIVVGRTFEVCLNVRNTGNLPEPLATVTFPVPADAVVTTITDDGTLANNAVVWRISNLPVNATKQVCVGLRTTKAATLNFTPVASSEKAPPAQSTCQTEVFGISAMLLEKSDDPDPVVTGETTTYTVRVTNQGTADDTNVQLSMTIAPELVPVSAAEGRIEGQTVTLTLIPKLAAKEAVEYKVVAKGVSAGDARTLFILTSDMLKTPVNAEESTKVY